MRFEKALQSLAVRVAASARASWNFVRARRALREFLIVCAFVALTAVMSYPWARHPRDTVSDLADPANIAYTLWWDYHQTFRAPLHLFDATIFYPYHDTLAFSEHDYGIAVLFFPVFAAGATPLAVLSLATFFAFVLCGYGAFRLARTLTSSYGAGWIAGLVFAFVPYRFHRLPHLHYIFACWIPLAFEALVLFVRARTWRSAAWLAAATAMNALTCITWFILSLIPLAATFALTVAWLRAWRDPRLWVRGAAASVAAFLVVLPFFLPYRRVAKEFGFVRRPDESQAFEARRVSSWFAASYRSKVWAGLGSDVASEEVSLFPGLAALALPLAALLVVRRRDGDADADEGDGASTGANVARAEKETGGGSRPGETRVARPIYLRAALIALDAAVVACGAAAVFAGTDGSFVLRVGGAKLVSVSHYGQALIFAALALLLRWVLSRTRAFDVIAARGWSFFTRPSARAQTLVLGALWAAVGFAGSFGMNFAFHRLLFTYVQVFRSQRVPAHWAMICYLGLALLAGLGASQLAEFFAARRRARPPVASRTRALVLAVVAFAVLGDLWVAPLGVVRGERLPDELTLRLKGTPMAGGIVHLPVFGPDNGPPNFEHMLRAADHGKPLITAASSFLPPLVYRVAAVAGQKPIPDEMLDVLEEARASYVVVTYSFMTPGEIEDVLPFLEHGMESGRLRFVRRFRDRGVKDLFAVVKTEPAARSEAAFTEPAPTSGLTYVRLHLPEQFGEAAFFICRLYRAAFGRAPTYAEFTRDAKTVGGGAALREEDARALVERTTAAGEFWKQFAGLGNREFVGKLYANAGVPINDQRARDLAASLDRGRRTRADALLALAEDEEFARRAYDEDFVRLNFFAFLERDPDPPGFGTWMWVLKHTGDHEAVTRAITSSSEYVNKYGAR
ncbi:MAG: DUF4214 domain-containing protein [Acidobacteria bacterium]|nr:DUF4214 domain-containing protein [Acidobacteriota bacterium]